MKKMISNKWTGAFLGLLLTVGLLLPAACITLKIVRPAVRPFDPACPQKVRSYPDFMQRISGLHFGANTVKVLGAVRYEKRQYPLMAVIHEGTGKITRRVAVFASVHGDEPSGTDALYAFLYRLHLSGKRLHGVRLTAVPIVNPWGWVHNSRYNGNGRDINRDFASFKTAEGRLIRKSFGGKFFDQVLDLHEASCGGSFIYCYSQKGERIGAGIIGRLQSRGRRIETDYRDLFLSPRDGIIRVPAALRGLYRMAGPSALAHYFLIQTPDAFTVEAGKYRPLHQRVLSQLEAICYVTDNGVAPVLH